MSSLFKSKRNNTDSKSSSKSGTESDSKAPKNSASAPPSKSGAAGGATPGTSSAPAAAAAPLPSNSKQSSASSKSGKVGRSKSFDAAALAEMESLPIDSRLMGSTVTDKTLSISRSGRYKAKGKARTPLFSDGSADDPGGDRRGATTTLASPEDRQTVLEAMATMRSGRSPTAAGAGEVKSDGVTSPKWSATPNSLDL